MLSSLFLIAIHEQPLLSYQHLKAKTARKLGRTLSSVESFFVNVAVSAATIPSL